MNENAKRVSFGFPRICLGGTHVDLCAESDFFTLVAERLKSEGEPLYVGSANLDHIHHFGDADLGYRWMTLLDGAPMTWMASLLTRQVWPRLAGSDLIENLLRIAEVEGCRVGFLGGRPEVHARAREVVRVQFPLLEEPAFWSPTRTDLGDSEVCLKVAQEIRDQDIRMLFVCLGKPRQEDWMHKYGDTAKAAVQLAFGASVDFVAGEIPRAPGWMRPLGLEWVFRLSREPRRLRRRYLVQGPPALIRLVLHSRR